MCVCSCDVTNKALYKAAEVAREEVEESESNCDVNVFYEVL